MSVTRENYIVLRSVYGKVGIKYYLQPCKDPKTGRYPECVKATNSLGDLILTDAERNSGKYYIKEGEQIIVEDGTVFNLNDDIQAAQWEAIKNCPLIAPERWAKDAKGDYLIDGTMDWKAKRPRYGIAELYVDRPGEEVKLRVSKKKKILQASDFIINDDNGVDGRLTMAKILGKRMSGQSDADVEDFLLQIAEKDPDKIIKLYTGGDLTLRILLVDAREAGVIFVRDKNYWYSDKILGGTDDAAITWMKNPKNKKILELIKKDTYPHLYPDTIDEPQGKDKTK
jgi:hypothetical protein